MSITLSLEEFRHLLVDNSVTLLDVRRNEDYKADPRTIPGATWRDPEQVDAWAAQLPPEKPVALYCARGGSVSKSVHAALAAKGFDARYLKGGFAAWDANKA